MNEMTKKLEHNLRALRVRARNGEFAQEKGTLEGMYLDDVRWDTERKRREDHLMLLGMLSLYLCVKDSDKYLGKSTEGNLVGPIAESMKVLQRREANLPKGLSLPATEVNVAWLRTLSSSAPQGYDALLLERIKTETNRLFGEKPPQAASFLGFVFEKLSEFFGGLGSLMGLSSGGSFETVEMGHQGDVDSLVCDDSDKSPRDSTGGASDSEDGIISEGGMTDSEGDLSSDDEFGNGVGDDYQSGRPGRVSGSTVLGSGDVSEMVSVSTGTGLASSAVQTGSEVSGIVSVDVVPLVKSVFQGEVSEMLSIDVAPPSKQGVQGVQGMRWNAEEYSGEQLLDLGPEDDDEDDKSFDAAPVAGDCRGSVAAPGTPVTVTETKIGSPHRRYTGDNLARLAIGSGAGFYPESPPDTSDKPDLPTDDNSDLSFS